MASPLVDTIAAAGGDEAGAPAVEVSTRHTFVSEKLCTYTNREPSAIDDTVGVSASWPTEDTRVGVPPFSASSRQSPPRAANKISRPPGSHAALPAASVDVSRTA